MSLLNMSEDDALEIAEYRIHILLDGLTLYKEAHDAGTELADSYVAHLTGIAGELGALLTYLDTQGNYPPGSLLGVGRTSQEIYDQLNTAHHDGTLTDYSQAIQGSDYLYRLWYYETLITEEGYSPEELHHMIIEASEKNVPVETVVEHTEQQEHQNEKQKAEEQAEKEKEKTKKEKQEQQKQEQKNHDPTLQPSTVAGATTTGVMMPTNTTTEPELDF